MRPRERLLHAGAENCSSAELLAIILRTGSSSGNVLDLAHRLLGDFKGLAGLDTAGIGELCTYKGLGEAKAIQVKAAFELGRRVVTLSPDKRRQIRSPRDIFNIVQADMRAREQELLRVLLLNTKNHVISEKDIYRGTLNAAGARVGEIFKEAIRQNSAALILVHNHPSGDTTPSPEDVQLTREVVQAGELLDIQVLDHVIIGTDEPGYFSLKERGLGFGAAPRNK